MNTEAVLGGLAVGVAVGALMSSQAVCMNAGFRRAVFERRPEIMRIFAIAVAAQLLLLPVLIALARGCITGILWKSGASSIATVIATAGTSPGFRTCLLKAPDRAGRRAPAVRPL